MDILGLDELDKLSDKVRMSIKNAPPKWSEIKAAAQTEGAGEWAMRKWLERRSIPGEWKVRIFERTKGRVSFADMEMGEAREPVEARG